ncbi:DivIVA domain-containing protein [Quadrisphaera granulorum]|uniref:DivIVA domain-containing protein n=1 Tax=Quadrisphaera granulorum TaxID=317664 RepID=UPI001B876312|nr:DivIVA domain-containing protein [Quadrisphaera granulorum]
MTLVLLLVAVAVVGVVVAVAAGRLPAGMPGPTGGSPHRPLPARSLEPADLDALRFSVVPRGYRMDEVDATLARLRAELAERDRRLEALAAAASTPVARPSTRDEES